MELFAKNNAVAIDGPAGSGKSTVARMVAKRLGFTYIDTGAMYRALTLKVMRHNLDLDDKDKIAAFATDMDFAFAPHDEDDGSVRVLLDGEDVSEEIRRLEVTVNVKHICKVPAVREELVRLQRKMADGISGTVMEGRDIGTVVLPEARHKFYLDASFDERVERRLAELRAKGHPVSRQDVSDDLRQRDHSDRTRKVGPLRKADDAVLVDTTRLSIEEVVREIEKQVREEG